MADLEIKPTAGMRARIFLVFSAATILAASLCWLLAGAGSELFVRTATLTTYIPDATGLDTDSVVRLSGLQVGTVRGIAISRFLDPQRAVRIDIRVQSAFLKDIPSDSQTSIDEDTIVGYQFVAINPGKSRVAVADHGVLQSEPVKQSLDQTDLLAALERNLTQVDEALIIMSSGQTKLGQFVIGSTEYDGWVSKIAAFDRSMTAFLAPGSRIGQALYSMDDYNYIHDLVVRADNSLAAIQAGQGTVGTLVTSDGQYTALVGQLSSLRSALADANSGRGRFAGMLQNDEEYRKISSLLTSTDALVASLDNSGSRFGELLTNAQLYESLNGSLQAIGTLLRDLNDHPRKYLRLRVFK